MLKILLTVALAGLSFLNAAGAGPAWGTRMQLASPTAADLVAQLHGVPAGGATVSLTVAEPPM
jgi:hypothetical protein